MQKQFDDFDEKIELWFEKVSPRVKAIPEFRECARKFDATWWLISDKMDRFLRRSEPEFRDALFSGDGVRAKRAIESRVRASQRHFEELEVAFQAPRKMAEHYKRYFSNLDKWKREKARLDEKFANIEDAAKLRHGKIPRYVFDAVGINKTYELFAENVAESQLKNLKLFARSMGNFERNLTMEDSARMNGAVEEEVRRYLSLLIEYEAAVNAPLAEAEYEAAVSAKLARAEFDEWVVRKKVENFRRECVIKLNL